MQDLASPHSTSAGVSSSSGNEDLIEDGPLFRAHVASLEHRALNLRQALKKLQRALESSLAALAATAQACTPLDAALEGLTTASLTSQGGALGGLYTRELRTQRQRVGDDSQREVDRTRELVDRVKGAIDRIKAVEERRKTFDAESKRYYDELAKYLARAESDPVKIASLDAKQAERAAAFRQDRVDFFAFLEGLVESEEGAVAAWLRTWAGLKEDPAESTVANHRTQSLALLDGSNGGRGKPRPSAGSSIGGESWQGHLEGLPDYLTDALTTVDEPSSFPPVSDDGHSGGRSVSGQSALSNSTTDGATDSVSAPSSERPRNRRSSLPVFGLGNGPAEKDKESSGKRDRLRGFFKSAHQSLSSALPTSSSSSALADVLSPRQVPPPLSPKPPMDTTPTQLSVPTPIRPVAGGPQPRKKEGFLYATETGQKHTTSGDAGARYHRYWVTLSEGQLVEYDRWTDTMQVHGSPINLLRASARISRQAGDRRFVFEVLTPELRRVYQADSDKECREWVAAIQKSVESLLNGTSSVRHFDASHLRGAISPSPLGELASSSSSYPNEPTSPRSRFPPFLTRRASAGQHSRKPSRSSSKNDKRRSVQNLPSSMPSQTHYHSSTPPLPSFAFDMDHAHRALDHLPDRSFYDASSRRGLWAFSDGDTPRPSSDSGRPALSGLGLSPSGSTASRSTPDLHRAPSPNGWLPSSQEVDEWAGDEVNCRDVDTRITKSLSPEEQAISDAVRHWATSSAPQSAPPAAPGSFTHPVLPSLAPEEIKRRNAERIAAVAARSDPTWDNTRCADCRAEAGAATWASWNLGITLCIRCSGVHRSLGTHVSKVRSIDLDDWNDEQLERMEQIGNARSNQYFEARLSPGVVESLTESMVPSFIREKYVDKRWADLEQPAPGLLVAQAL